MKYIGPIILALVLVLGYSILYKHEWMWSLGAITIMSVFVGITVTIVAEIRAPKKWEE